MSDEHVVDRSWPFCWKHLKIGWTLFWLGYKVGCLDARRSCRDPRLLFSALWRFMQYAFFWYWLGSHSKSLQRLGVTPNVEPT